MPSPPLSIVQSLSPRVAVLTSDDVADSCAANGCHGLEELLRPWEGGTDRVSILSTTLTPTIQPTFPLRFVSYGSVYSNPTASVPGPDVVMDLIGSVVGRHAPDEEQHYPLTRALLLSSRPLAPHETFNHPVGVLFAISTTTPDPLGTLQRLHGQAVATGAQAAPWMDGVQVLKFFVVVHDVSKAGASLDGANELLAQVKKAYGPHSTLLVINSQNDPVEVESPDVGLQTSFTPTPPQANDPRALSQLYAAAMANLTLSPMAAAAEAEGTVTPSNGPISDEAPPPLPPKHAKRYAQKLTPEDVGRLVALVRELVVQSLVPWMEARVREWNEAYQTNKRGITGRLFGAGRKLFGSSRPSSPSPTAQTGYNAVKGYYSASSIEALSRRLADFTFMLRDYRYASGVYDSLRRDYAQDRAFRYAAAATEMYGLSQLLSHNYFMPNTPPSAPATFTTLQHTEISSWLEQAVISYSARGGPHLDALRITVLYYEAWKAINEWRGVGAALVRAAGEADEVPCAVIVEEAASADVKGGKSKRGRRRQAFHLVMAARRYEKTGLKTYSRRCLERAAYLLRDAHWTAVRDRVEYSLGRQAYTLGESAVAVEHFLRLLLREDTAAAGSQGMVLEDLALAYEQLEAHPDQMESAKDKLRLPTPVFDITKTRLVLPAEGSNASGDWEALDSLALTHWDRKGKKPESVLRNPKRIVAAVGETLHVELLASNPLNAPVLLADLTLQVEGEADVELSEVSLEPYETRYVELAVTPKASGPITIKSASFLFHGFLPVLESLERRGRRLHATKAQRLTPTYAKDTSLTLHAETAAPRLAADLIGVPPSVYAGEIIAAELHLRNSGTLPVEDVQLISNHYGVLTLSNTQQLESPSTSSNIISANKPISLHSKAIPPGETAVVPVTFMAVVPGKLELLGLAVYSTPDGITASTRLAQSVEVKSALSIHVDVEAARKGYFVALDITSLADAPLDISSLRSISLAYDTRTSFTNATLYPNQSVRVVLRVAASDRDIDLRQERVVANLERLLQGDIEHLTPVEPKVVDLPATEPYVLSRRAHRLSFAHRNFPNLSTAVIQQLFPLFDPLDLDVVFEWTSGTRRGIATTHSIRPAPDFSLVEALRVDDTPAKRTMYEETGRLRRALAEHILEGPFATEDDPIAVLTSVPAAQSGRVSVNDGLLPFTIEVQNRSPILHARWILRLPPPKAGHSTLFTGELSHRGTLAPGESTKIQTAVWAQPGLISLSGWEVERETGDIVKGEWRPRESWVSGGAGPVVEVV